MCLETSADLLPGSKISRASKPSATAWSRSLSILGTWTLNLIVECRHYLTWRFVSHGFGKGVSSRLLVELTWECNILNRAVLRWRWRGILISTGLWPCCTTDAQLGDMMKVDSPNRNLIDHRDKRQTLVLLVNRGSRKEPPRVVER
jgi:hypothetical protein